MASVDKQLLDLAVPSIGADRATDTERGPPAVPPNTPVEPNDIEKAPPTVPPNTPAEPNDVEKDPPAVPPNTPEELTDTENDSPAVPLSTRAEPNHCTGISVSANFDAKSSEIPAVTNAAHPHYFPGSRDPLHWSWGKKHWTLFVMCFLTFLCDFTLGYGLPMTTFQMKEWKLSFVDAQRNISGGAMMQGFGSLLAVPLAVRYGVLPVMFWSAAVTFLTTVLCAVCEDWIGYIALRCIQGFFAAPGQVLGLTLIQNIFFFEEHARKIGIWGWSLLVGPYFGPFVSSFILLRLTWRESWGMLSVLVGLAFILVMTIDESTYDKARIENPQVSKNPLTQRLGSLAGTYGHRARGRQTVWQGCKNMWYLLFTPHFLLIFLFHGLTYMWSVGLNGTVINFLAPPKPKGYGFSTKGIGLIFLAPITAIVFGEVVGHFLNDYIQNRYIRAHNKTFKPEERLWPVYFSIALMPSSLVLLGVGLVKRWHWGWFAVFWGAFVFSCMTGGVAITAYALDCFPDDCTSASALLNFTRVLFGALVPWFQNKWADKVGANWSFTTQALICIVAFLATIPTLQVYGPRWRKRSKISPDLIYL